MKYKRSLAVLAALAVAATAFVPVGLGSIQMSIARASYRFANFQGRPPVHILRAAATKPQGIAPAEIKKIYNLPASGGSSTIAIIDAYDDATIEADLGVFDKMYGLAACTTKN